MRRRREAKWRSRIDAVGEKHDCFASLDSTKLRSQRLDNRVVKRCAVAEIRFFDCFEDFFAVFRNVGQHANAMVKFDDNYAILRFEQIDERRRRPMDLIYPICGRRRDVDHDRNRKRLVRGAEIGDLLGDAIRENLEIVLPKTRNIQSIAVEYRDGDRDEVCLDAESFAVILGIGRGWCCRRGWGSRRSRAGADAREAICGTRRSARSRL